MSERTEAGEDEFVTTLRAQKRRVLAALESEPTVDASPIVREGEHLRAEEYVTLVYELHHVHLPELLAAGLVAFDRGEDVVTRGPRFAERRPVDGDER